VEDSEKIAFYIYWDSSEQFLEKLGPIAINAYLKFNIKAVIITSFWQSFPISLMEEPWLKEVYRIDEYESSSKSKLSFFHKAFLFFTTNFKEVKFWKKQAFDLFNKYEPCAIFIIKPYFKEIPWIVKLANFKKIKTLFIGEYSVTFNQKRIKNLYQKNVLESARIDSSKGRWGTKFILFLMIYLLNGFIKPLLQSLAFRCQGIWDWKKVMYTIPSVTYHCVSNDLFASELKRLGCSKEKIIVTGVPEQDTLYDLNSNNPQVDLKGEKKKYGFNPQDNLIVFLMENFPALKYELTEVQVNSMINDVAKVVLKLPQTQFVIKVHPRDSSDYSWICNRYPEVIVVKDIKTTILVGMADICLAHGSTSISMTLPMNCTAFIIDLHNHWLCDILNKSYSIEKVNTTEKLYYCLLEKLKKSKNKTADLNSSPAKSVIDGNAVNRILNLAFFASSTVKV
jgi:hypothetical protein